MTVLAPESRSVNGSQYGILLANFDAAYHRAERDHFDTAIIDINLRDEAAYPIADELMRQRIPFVFCTGYKASLVPERFAGVRVFQKPFDPLEVVEYIRVLNQR